MKSLPSDLVFDILSRLPGKTLVRYRSVSKEFNALISDPQFLRLHHRRSLNSLFALHAFSDSPIRHPSIPVRLFLTDKDNILVSEFARQFESFSFRILPSCHQLVCFLCNGKVSLCDPIAQKFLDLPDSSSGYVLHDQFVSFGFVRSTMQYKVIRWLCLVDSIVEFEILTVSITGDGRLKISPWRSSFKHCPYLLERPPVLVDGYLYWKTADLQIVSFSLQDEKFSVLSPPPCFCVNHHDRSYRLFGLSGIRGNFYVTDYDVLKPALEIWMLSDRKNCRWKKLHRIELGETRGFSWSIVYAVFPIRMLDIRPDRVLFQLMFPSLLKCYSVARNSVDDYGEVQENFQLCHYTDGLLSLENVDI